MDQIQHDLCYSKNSLWQQKTKEEPCLPQAMEDLKRETLVSEEEYLIRLIGDPLSFQPICRVRKSSNGSLEHGSKVLVDRQWNGRGF